MFKAGNLGFYSRVVVSRALSTQGWYLFKDGTCSKVNAVIIEGKYLLKGCIYSRAAFTQGSICSRVVSRVLYTQGWYICSRVVYVQGWHHLLKDGICSRVVSRVLYTQGWYICSRVVYVQGWYMFKGSICSRVVSRVLSTQGWPLPVCVSQEV